MSKEHLVSKSVFRDQFVYVSGFEWCNGEEKRIGINSLQRKILCQKHNNDLSSVDDAGRKAIDAFEFGGGDSPLNGALLERWLVKTAVNLSIGGKMKIGCGMAESGPGWPSPYLVAVTFGDEMFCAGMGAYFIFPAAQYAFRSGEIMLAAIHRKGEIGGFVYGLKGQFIFLNLYPGYPPPPINGLVSGLLPAPIGSSQPYYRPKSIKIQGSDGLNGRIDIRWTI